MDDIGWDNERVFHGNNDLNVHVLQRRILDIEEAIRIELEPFFYGPSLFQLTPLSSQSHRQVLTGALVDVDITGSSLCLAIICVGSGIRSVWSLGRPLRLWLTVWRVDNKLDALQLNITSPDQTAYLQTGGKLLKAAVFDRSEGTISTELDRAVHLFHENAMGNGPEDQQ